jgi:putative hemolysin
MPLNQSPPPSFEQNSRSLLRIVARPSHVFSVCSPVPVPMQPATGQERPVLKVSWARNQHEVEQAQALRYRVFVDELGASLQPPAGQPTTGFDCDEFDDYCEHLIVRDTQTEKVVGTYRLLPPTQAKRLGHLYTETQFDITRLRHLKPKMVELGRSCVDPDYRGGATIMMMGGAIFKFLAENQFETMLGCASIPMKHQGIQGGDAATSIWRRVKASHLAAPSLQVYPRNPLPLDRFNENLDVLPPPLISAYLRMGAKVLGPPSWDPVFNTADLPILARIADLPQRYRQHFLGE